jgi:hypothetical protein
VTAPLHAPRLDPEKVWGLLTEAEARRAKKLIRQKKDGAVRAIIVAAMRRAETMPLSDFIQTKRERIAL